MGTATTMRRGPRCLSPAHRRAGRQAVVDQDGDLSGHVERRPVSSVPLLAPREFGLLARDDSFDGGLWYPETLDHFAIEHDHATGRDRSHGDLLVPGDPELADDEDVQWGAEARRDLVSDRDSAPGQGEHHDIPPAGISPQRVLAGVYIVADLVNRDQRPVPQFVGG
jgi:hypothetical protein